MSGSRAPLLELQAATPMTCAMCGRPAGRDALRLEVDRVVLTFRSVGCLRRYLREAPPFAADAEPEDAEASCWPASEWCL